MQSAEQILPGVWYVTTASHGGFILSDERQAAMPASLALTDPLYVEDADYALAVLAFEAEFRVKGGADAIMASNAHDTVRNWYPDRYAAFTGQPVTPRTSHVLDLRDAYAERIGRDVVVAAFGPWADWVPDGKTGVIARRLISVDQLARPRYADEDQRAMVDAARYEARGKVISLDELDAVPC
ncbi:MAG: hypothetical protein H0X36_01505 [Sphingomonadaceae bacterium]|nr:hypothetical protein [Sphingomonadaceae bacterium]